jgi:hypothetical protein
MNTIKILESFLSGNLSKIYYIKLYKNLLVDARENEVMAIDDEQRAIQTMVQRYPYLDEDTIRCELEWLMSKALKDMDLPENLYLDDYMLCHRIYAQRSMGYPLLLELYLPP